MFVAVPLAPPPVVHVLGRSVRGRPIRALEVGDPRARRKVVVVGCIHGNECAGIAVVRRLAHAAPPPGVDVWLVPTLNPDGEVAGTRQNAHGVDLNRNFPVGWRRSGSPWDTYYSGPRPLSERETRIAVRLILRVRPAVSIWYHQHQNVVRATSKHASVARRYARLARMRFRVLPAPPGAATRWQQRRFPGTSAFVVELPGGRLDTRAVRRHAAAVTAIAAPSTAATSGV